MRWIYLLLILIFTLAGGMVPVWFRQMRSAVMVYLLAFTGAFLFGITILHLIPESFNGLGKEAGLFILLGFFLQVFLQQWSHGMEHGHRHFSSENDKASGHSHGHIASATAFSMIAGLSVHAFMAGLPLGFTYEDTSTLPSLSLGILLHKMPEAFTLMVMLLHLHPHKKGNISLLALFSLVTPGAAILAYVMNIEFRFMDTVLLYLIAIVTGAFLHIATTIFFESGTRQHELNLGKVVGMVIGLCLAGLTLLIE